MNENDGTQKLAFDKSLPGAPNSPPVAAAGGCLHALLVLVVLFVVVEVLLLLLNPPPSGGGLAGAGVDAAGGVDGAAPPKALGCPVPNTVVVLFPQVTMIMLLLLVGSN
jgi:hypothetical protein